MFLNKKIEIKENIEEMKEISPYKATFILLGDDFSGKSTFLYKFINGELRTEIERSISFEIDTKNLVLNNKDFTIDIINLPSFYQNFWLNKFREKSNEYNGYIVLYDVTVKKSFEEAEYIIKNGIINYLKDKEFKYKIPLYLVANKIENFERRVISKEDGEELAKRNGFKYFEISVYNNIKVDGLMYSITIDYFMNFVKVNENKNKISNNKKNIKNCIIF